MMNVGIRAALAVLVVCGVAGCAATAPGPEKPPASTVQPLPLPTAEPVIDQPEPRMSMTCDDVLSPLAATQIVAPDVVALPTTLNERFTWPLLAVTLNEGALFCSWGNMPTPPVLEPNPLFSAASLIVVPISDADWTDYGPGDVAETTENELRTWCWSTDDGRDSPSCYFEGRVNGYWVDFSTTRIDDGGDKSVAELEALIKPVSDALTSALLAESLPDAWVPSTPGAPLPADCESFITPAQAEELTGNSPLGVGPIWDGPGRGLIAYGFTALDSRKCDFYFRDSDSSAGSAYAMPNGAWLARDVIAGQLAEHTAVAAEVAGLDNSEVAALSCQQDNVACHVNFTLHGNWIQVSVGWLPRDEYETDTAQGRERILEIASTIVANLAAAGV